MNWTSPTTAVSTVVQGVRGDAGRFGELRRGGGGGGEAEDVTAAARPGVGQDPEGGGLASAGGGDHQLQLAPVGGQRPHHRGLPGVQRRAAGCCCSEPEVDRGRSGLLPWRPLLHAVRAQLAADRELPGGLLAAELPKITWTPPQASYLTWLDCRALALGDNPAKTFLARGRIALRQGLDYGRKGAGFVRLNFGTSPEHLTDSVRRMARAIS